MTIKLISSTELFSLLSLEVNELRLKNKEFKYFFPNEVLKESVYVALNDDNEEIMGLAGFEKSPYSEDENVYWFNYVTVAPRFRGTGLAKQLIVACLRDISARDPGAVLKLSYTETGEVLRDVMVSAATDFGIELLHKKFGELDYEKKVK